MQFLLIRHGEISSNRNKVYAGRSEECLTDKGIQQAQKAAAVLKPYTVRYLYSSPIKRALQTAEIIGQCKGLHILVNDAFREMEMGPWEGLSEKEVATRYPEEWRVWNSNPVHLKLPGRETLSELLNRVLTGIRQIYKDGSEETVVVVTHVAVIRVLLLWHDHKPLRLYKKIHVPNAGVFSIKINARLE